MPLAIGSDAPEIPGRPADGPRAVVFYKVTCPTCQLAAPKLQALEDAYRGRVLGIGQDPPERLEAFGATYEMPLPAVSDGPPYDLSNAYGVRTVPTTYVIDADGRVADVVEAWDRDGLNRASGVLAELIGEAPVWVSDPADGLPAFKPG